MRLVTLIKLSSRLPRLSCSFHLKKTIHSIDYLQPLTDKQNSRQNVWSVNLCLFANQILKEKFYLIELT